MESQPIPLLDKLLRPRDRTADQAEINRLCDVVRQTSFEIHKYLRSGHLEKVYENALAHRLSKIGIAFIQQHHSMFVMRMGLYSAISVPTCLSRVNW